MVVEAAAFVVGEDEDGIVPGVALHKRIDNRLHVGCAGLDVVVGMLVESAAARGAGDEDNLRQSQIGVALNAAARASEARQKIADRESLGADGEILEVGKVGEEDPIFVVVEPAYVGRVHGAENGGRGILGVACIVRVFVPERCGGHQIHAVRHGIGENGRMPGVAGGEEAGKVVVVRQVGAVVIPHGTGAVGIVLLGYIVGCVEKVVHQEREGSGGAPRCITSDKSCVVMALIPRGGQVFGANGGLVERCDCSSGVGVGESDIGIEDINRGTVG